MSYQKKGNKMVQKEVLEFFITGQQNLENFNVLNPEDITMENNQILNVLQKHKKVTYHSLPIRLLFSGRIKTTQIKHLLFALDSKMGVIH